MKALVVLALCLQLHRISSAERCRLPPKGDNKQFPEDFAFGVSTAAYQIEGGWNVDGKGLSIWDTYTHAHPERIKDRTNGDEAAESYHRFEQDLVALKGLKVNFYRFSFSWPRLLPNADTSVINQKGIDYYNKIIDKLLANNIEPMVTMFHSDLPEALNKFGGFTNDIIIKYFRSYANFLYETFGDRVKKWITFNEPFDYCVLGYGRAYFPPLVHSPGVADYLCMDNTLRAHAAAYRAYKTKKFKSQGGKVGISISSRFYYTQHGDEHTIERAMQYSLGWLANPIFSQSGNYPQLVLDDIGNNSLREGLAWSRLPPFNEFWSKIIRGSADFLGLNYYTSRYAELSQPPIGEVPSWEYDSQLEYTVDEKWKQGNSNWLYCVPEGLEDILKWIRDRYDNVEVFVTENGWSDYGTLEDADRIEFLQAHLQAVLNAINDGCNVTHYSHWSLIDNFEWNMGYTQKYGLYYLNMTSPHKERIAKKSAHYYKNIIESKKLLQTIN